LLDQVAQADLGGAVAGQQAHAHPATGVVYGPLVEPVTVHGLRVHTADDTRVVDARVHPALKGGVSAPLYSCPTTAGRSMSASMKAMLTSVFRHGTKLAPLSALVCAHRDRPLMIVETSLRFEALTRRLLRKADPMCFAAGQIGKCLVLLGNNKLIQL
jgi:hypothetical protein